MKKRISPATAISLAALFFSLTGAGLAASRCLITSTSQIKPSVLHKLHGVQGPIGRTGAAGAPGAAGTVGIAKIERSTATGSVCAGGGGPCDTTHVTATCPTGSLVTGGAVHTAASAPGITTLTYVDATSYGATVVNAGPYSATVTVVAICVSGPGITAVG